ncbi:MBL fold metallo-hydrolase [Niveibacterium terrae]|uniref:MBL fold metallo-hydrolase n=1 Tax=Niveibacterium terrae TaxID=3373598 RepID=UPI003A93F948
MRKVRLMLLSLAALAALAFLSACAFLQQSKFGAAPEGERLRQIERSPHYAEGEFHNLIPTPILAEDSSTLAIVAHDALKPVRNLRPVQPIPVIKTDLKALDPHRDVVIWLGHSSFYVQLAGRRILIDPVLSAFASPVPFTVAAFDGTNLYNADDMPEIDLLLITHDHWDHLDYATLTALQDKVKLAVVALGVGAHLEHWAWPREKIRELDWYDELAMGDGFSVHLVPARHYSGRALTRNKTLWGGFVLESATQRLLFSGDTGYGPHFKDIAQRFGRFDLVALDMGQYDPRWPDIHMTPEQAAQAAEDLKTRAMLPAHIGRFSIARHAWNEPFERISAAGQGKGYHLLTPRIGEALQLDGEEQAFSPWWRLAARTTD